MKKPALLRAAITALLPDLARNPDKLAMWVEGGSVRATGNAQRGFAWEYPLTVVVEDFTLPPETLFFIVVDWLRTQQPDLLASNAEGFPFEADIIDDKTTDVRITLPLREIVTAVTNGSGEWQLTVQPEPVLFPDEAVIGPGITSIWVRGEGNAPFQIAPDPEA